jgi:hypothetical protein
MWVVLTLVAAAGLLAGYTFSVAQQLSSGRTGAMLALPHFFHAPIGNYSVLSGKAWSKLPGDSRALQCYHAS